MRFTTVREREVVDTLRENPDAHIIFPARAYRPDGRILIHRDSRNVFMSRYLFKLLIQPDLDSLGTLFLLPACSTWGCQNPYHFKAWASPKGEVAIRSDAVANATKTHCINGHPFTPENTRTDRTGARRCRECDRIRKAASRAASKES